MSHSYAPGLRVSGDTRIRRERRLPLPGQVLVSVGDLVAPDTVVARTELPGNVQFVNLAARLSVDPARVADTLSVGIGESVEEGCVIAASNGLFGFVRNEVTAPCHGTIESVSIVTGQLLLREPPIPVEVNAYVSGRVVQVLSGEGVVVEMRGAFLQGIFGVGGEAFGPIAVAVAGPEAELRPQDIRPEHRGCIVVGGSFVSHQAILHARLTGVAAIVVGGFDDHDLKRLLGRDLGVAITGAENIGLSLVLTEGFGRIPMAQRAWKLLGTHEGKVASISGATQIRAGVMRPEILVPHEAGGPETPDESEGSLEVGSVVRVIREPHFGLLGRVTALPPELHALDTEAMVRVLEVDFGGPAGRHVVPRANVECIFE